MFIEFTVLPRRLLQMFSRIEAEGRRSLPFVMLRPIRILKTSTTDARPCFHTPGTVRLTGKLGPPTVFHTGEHDASKIITTMSICFSPDPMKLATSQLHTFALC
jgi:hypothetical protein